MTGQPQGIAPTKTNDIVGAILYGCPNWARNFRYPALAIFSVVANQDDANDSPHHHVHKPTPPQDSCIFVLILKAYLINVTSYTWHLHNFCQIDEMTNLWWHQ